MVYPTPMRAAPFKSSYGPKYQFQPNVNGVTGKTLMRFGMQAGAFGGAGVVALMLFASSLPRVRLDVLSGIPVVGQYFVKEEVHPADNPF